MLNKKISCKSKAAPEARLDVAEVGRDRAERRRAGAGLEHVLVDDHHVARPVFVRERRLGKGDIEFDLLRGGARVVTGKIALNSPKQFFFRTPHTQLTVERPAETWLIATTASPLPAAMEPPCSTTPHKMPPGENYRVFRATREAGG